MDGRLLAGQPPQHFTKPLMPTQPPILSGTGNEYCSQVRERSAAEEQMQVWFIPLVDKRVMPR